MNKTKNSLKLIDDSYWDCSVCTYRNTPEGFKCQMCDVRKGTSTRKPKINQQLAAVHHGSQQQNNVNPKSNRRDSDVRNDVESFTQRFNNLYSKSNKRDNDLKDNVGAIAQKYSNVLPKSYRRDSDLKDNVFDRKRKYWHPRRLKNLDRHSAQSREVTVKNVTVIITEYKLQDNRRSYAESVDTFSSASEMSNHSESSRYDSRASSYSSRDHRYHDY